MSSRLTSGKAKAEKTASSCTLDLVAIGQSQFSNAVLLENYQKQYTDDMMALHEKTGLNFGYKLYPEDMAWLGAGSLSNAENSFLKNNAQHFPSFLRLPRAGQLKGKCRISLKHAELQSWVEKIWNGQGVYYVYLGDECEEEGVCFKIVMITVEGQTIMQFKGNAKGSMVMGEAVLLPALEQVLEFNDRGLFVARTMHHFLRQYAYMVPDHLLYQILNGQCEMALSSKKYKEDFLDWQILRADLVLNLPQTTATLSYLDAEDLGQAVCKCLMKVGCALASLARWEEASSLYIEIGDTFKDSMRSYDMAGRSFMCVGDWDKALEMFLKALHRLGKENPNPNFDDVEDPFCMILEQLIFVHQGMYEIALTRHDQNIGFTKSEDVSLAIAYLGLLVTARFKSLTKERGVVQTLFGIPNNAACRDALKVKLQRPKVAKKVLLGLVQSGSVEEYKRKLLGVGRINAVTPMAPSFDTAISKELRQLCEETAAKSAQAMCKKGSCSAAEIRFCGKCRKWIKLADCKVCACGKADYCSVECQRADFKKHKSSCAWYRKTKGKSENAESDDRLVCGCCGTLHDQAHMKWCPCRTECYCSKSCQEGRWKDHKMVCPWFLEKKQNETSA